MFHKAHRIIEEYFLANWTQTPFTFVNEDRRMPSDQAWIRFSIVPNTHYTRDDGYIAFSPTTIEYRGHIAVQIFCPLNTGSGESERIADALSELFLQKTLDDIVHIKAPSVQNIGYREGWYQTNVITPFYYQIEIIESGS